MKVLALTCLVLFLSAVHCKRKDGKRKSDNEKYKVLPNICGEEHRNSPLMCQCSDPAVNASTSAHCWVIPAEKISHFPADQFSSQANLMELKFMVRNNAYFPEIPTAALQHLRKLRTLKIEYASIYEIKSQAFANASFLTDIELLNDGITVLHPNAFSYLINLNKVHLDNNNIYELQPMVFHHVPNLERLSIRNNNLTILHDNAFRFLNRLFELELNENSISIITREIFNGLFHLKRLDLTSNKLNMIGEFTFAEMPELQELILDSNKLTYIADRAFAGLPALRRLTLSDNQLNTISDQLFLDNTNIEFLNLRDNSMVELKSTLLKPIWHNFKNHSAHLLLSGNQFPCDCYLSWVYQLKNETNNKNLLSDLEELTCILGEDMLSNEDSIASSEQQDDQYVDNGVEYEGEVDVEYEALPDESGPPRKKILDIPQEDMPCPEQLHATTEEPRSAELPSRSASASSSASFCINVSLFAFIKTVLILFLT